MSGCKGSYGLGVGEGLPARLSLSGCLSSKNVCCLFLLILFSDCFFKKLDYGRKACMKFLLHLPTSQKIKGGYTLVHWKRAGGGWSQPPEKVWQLGLG